MSPIALVTLLVASFHGSGRSGAAVTDSILIVLPGTTATVVDRVIAAFVHAGVDVSRADGVLIEAEQSDLGAALSSRVRLVRALVFARDSTSSLVLLTALEWQGPDGKRSRIRSTAGGNGRVVWCRMVKIARALDPAIQSEPRLNSDCGPR